MIDSRNIADLQPGARLICKTVMAAWTSEGLDPIITCTYRSLAESARLYAKGRTMPGKIVTNAKPGESFHNWRVAWDAYPRIGGTILWNYDDTILHQQHWDEMGGIAKANGCEWGREWHSIHDTPHFQFTEGKPLSFFQQGGTI